jgi:hypothetical protein
MSNWFVIVKRETCPDCYGTKRCMGADEERLLFEKYGTIRAMVNSPEYIAQECRKCNSQGYIESVVDLREALIEVLGEAMQAEGVKPEMGTLSSDEKVEG